MAFQAGEQVLLKFSPIKGVIRFGKKAKLSPRYIGPFEIIDCVGLMAYRLVLPPSLSGFHPVFHYEEESVAILDRDIRKLRNEDMKSMKVQWKHHPVDEATWKTDKDVRDTPIALINEPAEDMETSCRGRGRD
ncbi:hypothetical protein MTR67_048051 [Solanum verrucosum]|uniref:Tf2-1-like SH3-like domain-containing protein n=1 Tax=Solanum verrucosum TaxID=315347 RepID=A0AAF0V0I8_SOLVR|nr:hypothetical protein MTR67_048051 [Solanum verrucosum]